MPVFGVRPGAGPKDVDAQLRCQSPALDGVGAVAHHDQAEVVAALLELFKGSKQVNRTLVTLDISHVENEGSVELESQSAASLRGILRIEGLTVETIGDNVHPMGRGAEADGFVAQRRAHCDHSGGLCKGPPERESGPCAEGDDVDVRSMQFDDGGDAEAPRQQDGCKPVGITP